MNLEPVQLRLGAEEVRFMSQNDKENIPDKPIQPFKDENG